MSKRLIDDQGRLTDEGRRRWETPREQPPPTPSSGPCIQDLVIEDIRERTRLGIERYGTVLRPHNGRDALRDAYEEAMDLVIYLRQVIAEFGDTEGLQVRLRGWCEHCGQESTPAPVMDNG